MNDLRREITVGVLVVVLLLMGIAVDAFSDDVEPAPEQTPAPLFVERSSFCLGLPGDDEVGAVGDAAVAASGTSTEQISIGSEPSQAEPEVVRGGVLEQTVREPGALQMIGYGATAMASSSLRLESPLAGMASANCSRDASMQWLFPAGSSEQGFNEWIVLLNPFRDEAVVRVDLLTADGPRTKSQLSDVSVPSGGMQVLKMNDYILQQDVLGVRVVAGRGRVVAWKSMFAQAEGMSPGVGTTLGARQGATDWYFPVGAIGPGAREVLSILNPSDDEAIVTVSLTATEGAVQPPADLVEFTMPAETTTDIDLSSAFKKQDLGGVSVSIRSVNEVPIVAERSLWYSDEGFKGFATELGASQGARAWWVGSAATSSDRDSLVLLNTSGSEATVQITLMTPKGQPIEGGLLADITVPAGGRTRVDLDDLVDGTSVALVTSDTEVVAERVVYSSATEDVATIMGIPLPDPVD
ncbi:MAG: DUF5719 family protein [Actinomycetota bacterium]